VLVLLTAFTDIPVDPDAETARRWAAQELADPIYHQGTPLWERLYNWIGEQLDTVHRSTAANLTILLWALVALVVIIVVSFAVAGPVQRSRALRRVHPPRLLDDDSRTAAQIRADAAQADTSGDAALALAEWFRATVRGLEERTLLDEQPGRTADEVVRDVAPRLSALGTDLTTAAHSFDRVVYGRGAADRDQAAWMRSFHDRVRAAHPTAPMELS